MFGTQPPALATLFLEMGQWEGLGSPQNIASLPPSSSSYDPGQELGISRPPLPACSMGMRKLWDPKSLDEPGSQGAVHGAGAVRSSSHPAPFQSLTQPSAFSPYGSPCALVIFSQVYLRNNLAGKAK